MINEPLEMAFEPSGVEPHDIHFHFPLEVAIIGDISREDAEALEARIWESLHQALLRG